jgi:hypothetical protein
MLLLMNVFMSNAMDCRLAKKLPDTGHWWLMPVILAIQEAEIRRITV